MHGQSEETCEVHLDRKVCQRRVGCKVTVAFHQSSRRLCRRCSDFKAHATLTQLAVDRFAKELEHRLRCKDHTCIHNHRMCCIQSPCMCKHLLLICRVTHAFMLCSIQMACCLRLSPCGSSTCLPHALQNALMQLQAVAPHLQVDSLVHGLQHPDGLLPALVVLLSLQMFCHMHFRMHCCETQQLQSLAAVMEAPDLMTLYGPLHTDTSRDFTPGTDTDVAQMAIATTPPEIVHLIRQGCSSNGHYIPTPPEISHLEQTQL